MHDKPQHAMHHGLVTSRQQFVLSPTSTSLDHVSYIEAQQHIVRTTERELTGKIPDKSSA